MKNQGSNDAAKESQSTKGVVSGAQRKIDRHSEAQNESTWEDTHTWLDSKGSSISLKLASRRMSVQILCTVAPRLERMFTKSASNLRGYVCPVTDQRREKPALFATNSSNCTTYENQKWLIGRSLFCSDLIMHGPNNAYTTNLPALLGALIMETICRLEYFDKTSDTRDTHMRRSNHLIGIPRRMITWAAQIRVQRWLLSSNQKWMQDDRGLKVEFHGF